MTRKLRVDRRGQGVIALLLVAVTVGYLYKSGLLKMGGSEQQAPLDIHQAQSAPRPVVQPQASPPPQQAVPVTAVENTFKITAQEVRSAVAVYQMQKSGLPSDLAELHRETGLDLKLDPYGGQYYVKDGWLKCTGNPKLYEKVW